MHVHIGNGKVVYDKNGMWESVGPKPRSTARI